MISSASKTAALRRLAERIGRELKFTPRVPGWSNPEATVKRIVLLGCASLALASSTIAAQSQPTPAPVPPTQPLQSPPPATLSEERAQAERAAATPERAGPTDNQIADEVDARIAQLKANMRLTPEQDGKWSGIRDALREAGIQAAKRRYAAEEHMGRHDRRGRRDDEPEATATIDQGRRANDIAMMRQDADQMAADAASLKKVADAAEPLYDILVDRQRRILMRFVARGFDRAER